MNGWYPSEQQKRLLVRMRNGGRPFTGAYVLRSMTGLTRRYVDWPETSGFINAELTDKGKALADELLHKDKEPCES